MLRYDQYLETQVMTAKPHQLHLMVIDGAIRFATKAKEALEESNFEDAHLALNSSRGFVVELISGLDPTHAPEMTEQLRSLFFFVYRNLVNADRNRDPNLVHAALRILKLHRETWVELIQRLGEENVTVEQPARERSWTT